MASDGKIKESHPANTSPPTAAAASSSRLARSASVVLAALMSASFFVEPFADAAANLGLPCPAFVVTLLSSYHGDWGRRLPCCRLWISLCYGYAPARS
jgi:hypothetical protein